MLCYFDAVWFMRRDLYVMALYKCPVCMYVVFITNWKFTHVLQAGVGLPFEKMYIQASKLTNA